MADGEQDELLLGKQVASPASYAPDILCPIARAEGRSNLGLGDELPFSGTDVWHAWEMSWLDAHGKPVAKVGRFDVPADSDNIIESKSFKLYLNSLNNKQFDETVALRELVERDVSQVAGAPVSLTLLDVDDTRLAPGKLPGECIDSCSATAGAQGPRRDLLRLTGSGRVAEALYSHLLRSLCPVTGQPDWATLRVNYEGPAIDRAALLTYILSYREHQEFHEQCVERIFCDIQRELSPQTLSVQAFYTRRGGLDINPFRSSSATTAPILRLHRQ